MTAKITYRPPQNKETWFINKWVHIKKACQANKYSIQLLIQPSKSLRSLKQSITTIITLHQTTRTTSIHIIFLKLQNQDLTTTPETPLHTTVTQRLLSPASMYLVFASSSTTLSDDFFLIYFIFVLSSFISSLILSHLFLFQLHYIRVTSMSCRNVCAHFLKNARGPQHMFFFCKHRFVCKKRRVHDFVYTSGPFLLKIPAEDLLNAGKHLSLRSDCWFLPWVNKSQNTSMDILYSVCLKKKKSL